MYCDHQIGCAKCLLQPRLYPTVSENWESPDEMYICTLAGRTLGCNFD